MGFNFFEPLPQFSVLFMKSTPILCLYGTVNINKAIITDEKVIFALHYTI